MPTFFNDGNTPARSDGIWKIEQKILGALVDGGGGSGGGVGAVMRGSGPPVAAPANPLAGAIYYDDDSGSPSYDVSYHWSVPGQLWIGA